jgi:hypothetical protein
MWPSIVLLCGTVCQVLKGLVDVLYISKGVKKLLTSIAQYEINIQVSHPDFYRIDAG